MAVKFYKIEKMTQTDQKRELINAGERLKHVRVLLRVSRAYLQDKYGLPEVTLKSWENGTVKLTSTGTKRCVEIYRNEGIIVSEDWIMEGIGLDPTASVNVSKYFAMPTSKNLPTEDDEVCMLRDANTFKESYEGGVIMIVSNDDMRPFYKPGDYIGGKMRFLDAADSNAKCNSWLNSGQMM